MNEPATIENRLSDLEREVAELKRHVANDWLSRLVGSQEDEPEFDLVLEMGKTIRQADRPQNEK